PRPAQRPPRRSDLAHGERRGRELCRGQCGEHRRGCTRRARPALARGAPPAGTPGAAGRLRGLRGRPAAGAAVLTAGPVWYLMRASGLVALILLSCVVVLGVATANRFRPGALPRFVTLTLHRDLSLLAVAFLAVHV